MALACSYSISLAHLSDEWDVLSLKLNRNECDRGQTKEWAAFAITQFRLTKIGRTACKPSGLQDLTTLSKPIPASRTPTKLQTQNYSKQTQGTRAPNLVWTQFSHFVSWHEVASRKATAIPFAIKKHYLSTPQAQSIPWHWHRLDCG